MKNILYIWFSHFTLTKTHRCKNHSLSLYFNKKNILRVDSSRRARDTAAMLDHSRHRGESATKTVKFFVAHTVNCVICNNHTIIDWMLLNFTPLIQQNCHQNQAESLRNHFAQLTGWQWLSCQLELSKSETSQFRSDRVFDIVDYVHVRVIFLHGECCFEIFNEFRLLCCKHFMGQ